MALAAYILGTSIYCDWQEILLFQTIFQTGNSRYWLGGPPPTCSSLGDNKCSVEMDESFGLSELGIFFQGSQQSTILMDDAFKCSRYLEVANISEHLILTPSDIFD